MSLMSINETRNELRKLTNVIEIIKLNYKNNYEQYDIEYNDIKNDLEEKLKNCNTDKEYNELIKIEKKYTEDLKTYSKVQNELIFVKHFFLIENMIIDLFKQVIYLTNDVKYHKEFFIDKNFFNNIITCSKKIKELTKDQMDLSLYPFWKYLILMKEIRNSISHGNILFTMKYKNINFFNNKYFILNNNQKIEFIVKYEELNEDFLMKHQYPTLLHPTYLDNSKWYAHLSDNIEILEILNKEYLKFIEEIRKYYLSYLKNEGKDLMMVGMGRTFLNKSIYQNDYLTAFKSLKEFCLKKDNSKNEDLFNEIKLYQEFKNNIKVEYDNDYLKMIQDTNDALDNKKSTYIYNATFNFEEFVIYLDLIKKEKDSKEISIYIKEENNKLLEFQIYILLNLKYIIKDIKLITIENKKLEIKNTNFLEEFLSTKNKKQKFIERMKKNLEVIKYCKFNPNKPIKDEKLKN